MCISITAMILMPFQCREEKKKCKPKRSAARFTYLTMGTIIQNAKVPFQTEQSE